MYRRDGEFFYYEDWTDKDFTKKYLSIKIKDISAIQLNRQKDKPEDDVLRIIVGTKEVSIYGDSETSKVHDFLRDLL